MTPLLLLAATTVATPDASTTRHSAGHDDTPALPYRLTPSATTAFGVTHAKFVNQLVGLRFDYRFGPRFSFGGVVSYANLKGKDGRVSNMLPEVTLGYRIGISDRFGIPLRYSLGFLPKNGPTMRLGAGLDIGLSDSVSLELTPLESMLWVTRDAPEVSFDGTLALAIAW